MSASPHRRSRSPSNEGIRYTGNNLYISNLSYKTQEQDLHDKFSDFGKIKNCKVIKDPYTNKSRGFGFVTFESSDDAAEARNRLNGSSLDGRELRIEIAKRSRAYSPTPGNYLVAVEAVLGGLVQGAGMIAQEEGIVQDGDMTVQEGDLTVQEGDLIAQEEEGVQGDTVGLGHNSDYCWTKY